MKKDLTLLTDGELCLNVLHNGHYQQILHDAVENGNIPLLKIMCDEFFIYTEQQWKYLLDYIKILEYGA